MAIPNKSPLKLFGENGAWAHPGTVQIFLVSPISRERVKLRTSNLASTFTGPIRIKAHKKFWRKGSMGISRGCPILLGTPYYLRNG